MRIASLLTLGALAGAGSRSVRIKRGAVMVMHKMTGVLLAGLLAATLMLTGCGDDGDGPAEIGAFVLDECRLNDPDCRLQ